MLSAALISALHAAAVCEVVWLAPGGRPDAVAATPLVFDGRPAVAFPYAYAELGRAIAAAGQVGIVVSDSRLSGSAWRPIAVLGRPRLIEDADGSIFTEFLLGQELRKHPPSRTLADSPILRREHWWFLPRVIVVVEPDAVHDVGARAGGADDGVLGVAVPSRGSDADHLRIAAVGITSGPGAAVQLTPIGESGSAGREAGPAVLICHDFSTPDIERWTSRTATGTVTGMVLDVDAQDGDIALAPPLRLMERIRRQRDLGRACRRALTSRSTKSK